MDVISYKDYHRQSIAIGDVDPSYEMLRYVCNRFELNTEQRYWLAFLYACCYCGPTVYYIYNEFPDFENVDEGRLERWWYANKDKLLFQTDRAWVRSKNQLCDIFKSYKKLIGNGTQEEKFKTLLNSTPQRNYVKCFKEFSKVYQFGRFAMFLYLEAVQVVTGIDIEPNELIMAEAESCRNGLCFAIGREDLMNHETEAKIDYKDMDKLQIHFNHLVRELKEEDPKNTIWNIETTLCAYKKYRLGKRYIGFYLDRQKGEIEKLEKKVVEGVCWKVLWDYRKETYKPEYLKELS